MKLDSQLPCWVLDFFPIECRACSCGFQSTATRESLGTISLSSSSRFPASSGTIWDNPVTLPPGRARLSTSPARNRVTRSHHNDRDSPGSFFGSQSIGSSGSDDDVNLETDEIGREVREAIVSTLRIAVLDADVLSLDPSEVAETEPECLVPERGSGRREWREKSYPRNFRWLLRLGPRLVNREYDSESNNPHQFLILDFRFPIIGIRIENAGPEHFFHVSFLPSIENRQSKI